MATAELQTNDICIPGVPGAITLGAPAAMEQVLYPALTPVTSIHRPQDHLALTPWKAPHPSFCSPLSPLLEQCFSSLGTLHITAPPGTVLALLSCPPEGPHVI